MDHPIDDTPARPQTFLLVDDDKTIVMVIKKLLEAHGYRVFSATSAEEALALFQHQSHDINLLITDVVMPKMSGTELARHVRAVRPTMPVLFISGVLPERAVLTGTRSTEAFLPKPVTSQQLSVQTYRLLHRAT